MGFFDSIADFMTGTPEVRQNVSTLRKSQKPAYKDLQRAAKGKYGSGSFGQAGQYYSDLLSNDSADQQAFAAPAMRQFNEEIIPDLSEQFAGMGSGGLSSSGFRNAGIQAGSGLAERLAAMRANLRQSGAQGLQNIGNSALGNFSQNQVTQQGSPGFLSQAAPLIGQAGAMAIGGPAGSALYNAGNSLFGSTSPYGNGSNGMPQAGGISR